MDIAKATSFSACYGLYPMQLLSNMKITVTLSNFKVFYFIVEKYNTISQDSTVSNEDLETLQSFKSELLKIAASLNLSIVDENDIQSIISVCTRMLE